MNFVFVGGWVFFLFSHDAAVILSRQVLQHLRECGVPTDVSVAVPAGHTCFALRSQGFQWIERGHDGVMSLVVGGLASSLFCVVWYALASAARIKYRCRASAGR